MLVLSRKEGESISIHGPSRVVIVGVSGRIARLGIKAARDVLILRDELQNRPLTEEPLVEFEVGQDIKREIA